MISNPMFYWKHSNKKLKVKVFSADRPYNSDTICCPALGDPVDCSTPGSSVHGILWARILEWLAMPSSRGSS